MAYKRRAAALTVVGGAALLATACNISIDTDGESAIESFEVEDFTEVEIGGAFTTDIVVGEDTAVEVEIDDEIVDRLSVKVESGRLIIGLEDGLVSTSGPMHAIIHTPGLDAVDIDGAAKVEVEGLDAESFDLQIDGASQFGGVGSIADLTLDADGASKVDLDDATVTRASVDLDGAANVDFEALDEVQGTVTGAASLDIPDGTSVDVDTSGAGSVNQ